MQKIIPHLWFDKEAKEAAEFYSTTFPRSRVTSVTTLRDTPSGDCDVVSFEVWGHEFMTISAGPLFKFNPSVSFIVNFDRSGEKDERLDAVWERLVEGGSVLMPLDRYPFSERYGWVQDKYGVSWQLMLSNAGAETRPSIMPFLLFVGENCGRAEDAINFYLSLFNDTKQGQVIRYGPNQCPDKEGTLMFSDFMIENQWLAAMDSAHEHRFAFNEAISLLVYCDTQEEIDYFWDKLSAVPEAEQCGWLKDRYGLSWQITPSIMKSMMASSDEKKRARLTRAFLQMKKFDIKRLQDAFRA